MPSLQNSATIRDGAVVSKNRLDCQTLRVPGHDYRVVLYTAEPGSPDEEKLRGIEAGLFDKVTRR